MRIDMGEVRALAVDMRGVEGRVVPKVRATLSKGALNTKQEMQADLLSGSRGGGTHGRVAADVSYDFTAPLVVEVGPTLDDVGSLQLLYFGNSKTGPTAPDPIRLLKGQADALERYVADAGEESVW